MSDIQFGFALVISVIIYNFKTQIILFLNILLERYNISLRLKDELFNYLLAVVLALVLGFGMLSGVKQKGGDVTDGFDNMQGFGNNRPNPLFDIDTYW